MADIVAINEKYNLNQYFIALTCSKKERRSSTGVAFPPNVLNIVHEEDSFGSVKDKQTTMLDDDIKGKVAKKSPEIESSEVKDSATVKSYLIVESP